MVQTVKAKGRKEQNKGLHQVQALTTPAFGLTVPCTPCKPPNVYLREDGFGMCETQDGSTAPVRQFTWYNRNRITVSVINYGATIIKMEVPDRKGVPDDIVLGFDDITGPLLNRHGDVKTVCFQLGYCDMNNPAIGGLIGRVCHKIYNGNVLLDGKLITVTKNHAFKHFKDGGCQGFHKVLWDARIEENTKVLMTYLSKDGEEGFPGAVLITLTFELAADNKFLIDMHAISTEPTPINLTYNNYFNLAGDRYGEELFNHYIMINADSYTLQNEEGFVTGQIRSVANKPLDLQIPQKIGKVVQYVGENGFNHNYCINRGFEQDLNFAVRLVHPSSGRVMEMYTNQPGVLFYSGGDLPELSPEEMSITEDNPGFEMCCEEGVYPCPKMGFDCTQGEPCHPTDPNKPCCMQGLVPCPVMGYDCMLTGEPCVHVTDRSPCCKAGEYPCSKLGFECNDGNPCTGTPFAADMKQGPICGRRKTYYHKNGALCINSANYPEAMNYTEFPNCILRPGQSYRHKIVYRFWLIKGVPLPS